MKRKTLLCLALILSLSYVYGAKVSPVRFDLSIARGASQEFTLNLMGSKGFYNQALMLYPTDLFMSRNGALSFDTIAGSKNSAVRWIKMEISKLSLLEDQAKDVKFTISIPSNAVPGEYYAVIMVEPVNYSEVKDKNNPVMLQMKSRVAVVVVLEVPGRTYIKKGEVAEMKIVETDSLVKISSSFKNTGNIHLDVLAEVTIRSADGRTNYGKFDLSAMSSAKKEAFIFPGAMRDFDGALNRQLPAGNYLADVSYNYGYAFNKAHQILKFSIERKSLIDESKAEFLSLKNKEIRLLIPKGSRRTQVVTITNIDYRPLSIQIVPDEWIKINPDNFILKPGEVRNLMLNISVPEYDESQQKETILYFKTDRGIGSEMKIFVSGLKENLEKKVDDIKVLNNNLKNRK